MTRRTGTPWIKSKNAQLFGYMHRGGREGGSHVQRTHNNTIALLSSGEKGALCFTSKCPFPSANPDSRSCPDRRPISTSSASTLATKSSTSSYFGRTAWGVRGVICAPLSEVETPGERTGGLGISRKEFCGGGNGERLFRLRSREGI